MSASSPSPTGAACPVCGAFVGPLSRCSSCGARIRHRISLRIFRWMSVLLATVGLALLWTASQRRDLPLVQVADIQPTMNFAYVRIQGRVVSDARVFQEGGRVNSLRFSVDDGTGELDVRALRDHARVLADSDRVPQGGDRIELTGSLNISADTVSLWLQAPERMTLERATVEAASLGSLSVADDGRSVYVEARVLGVEAPPPGSRAPWRIRIQDDSGEAAAVFFGDTFRALADPSLLVPDARIRGRARIGQYRGNLQLVLGRDLELSAGAAPVVPEGIVLNSLPQSAAAPDTPAASAPAQPASQTPAVEPTRLADLSVAMTGRTVRVSGRVVRVFSPPAESRAPWRVELEADGGRGTIIYWTDVAGTLGEAGPVPGELWEATGTVGLYREKIQIQVRNGSDLRRLEAAPAHAAVPEPPAGVAASPPAAAPVALTGLDQLTPALTGQTVRVSARLGPARPLRSGVAYALVGGATNLQVVLWDRFVPAASRSSMVEGAEVEITGLVKAFKDRLEIVPQSPDGVTVQPGAPSP